MPLSSLPPVLPTRSSSSVPSLGPSLHAQDFSVLKLQQKKDLEASRVSMNQVLTEQNRSRLGASTSISHIGQTSRPTTSINRPASTVDETDESSYQEGADRRRYTYVRKLIKERQAKEAVTKTEQKVPSFHTGSGFVKKKFHKSFAKMVKLHPATYNSLSATDKKFFEEMVTRHAKSKVVGVGFSRLNRLNMRHEIETARRSGQIGWEDAKLFQRMIQDL